MALHPLNPEQAAAIQRVKNAPGELHDEIMRHRAMAARRDVAFDLAMHGKLECVYLERPLRRGEDRRMALARLDWNGQGPKVALSRNGTELLFLEPVARELPDLPAADPLDLQKTLRDRNGDAVMRPQRWEDAGAALYQSRGGDFLVYRPVKQIVFLKTTGGGYGNVICRRGVFDDFTALLVNPLTGEAYFIGGTLEFAAK